MCQDRRRPCQGWPRLTEVVAFLDYGTAPKGSCTYCWPCSKKP